MADYKSSNTDTIVKIILVFFISLLSFSIGTFVGKKFSDNQHKLATMEPGKGEEKHSTAAGAEGGHASAEDTLSDDQVAALANEFVDDETPSANKTENAHGADHETEKVDRHAAAANEETTGEHEPASEKPNTKVDAPAPSTTKNEAIKKVEEAKPAEKSAHANHEVSTKHDAPVKHDEVGKQQEIVKHEESAKTEEIAKIPTAVAKDKASLGTNKFTIQIASYPSESEAQKKADELKKLNFEAFYTPATIKGQTWFRVNVGTFATTREAQDHKNDLVEKTHINSAIIQKLVQ